MLYHAVFLKSRLPRETGVDAARAQSADQQAQGSDLCEIFLRRMESESRRKAPDPSRSWEIPPS
jgi:hypothetical protein